MNVTIITTWEGVFIAALKRTQTVLEFAQQWIAEASNDTIDFHEGGSIEISTDETIINFSGDNGIITLQAQDFTI